MNNMSPDFKKVFTKYLDALEGFAATRGDGPYFQEDRDESEEELRDARKALNKEISKL